MNTTDRNQLSEWFGKRGHKPLGSQFVAWINSFWHKDDRIPAGSIDGLQEAFDMKFDNDEATELTTKVGQLIATSATHEAAVSDIYDLLEEMRQDVDSAGTSIQEIKTQMGDVSGVLNTLLSL